MQWDELFLLRVHMPGNDMQKYVLLKKEPIMSSLFCLRYELALSTIWGMLFQGKLLHGKLIGENSWNQNFAEELSPAFIRSQMTLRWYLVCNFKPLQKLYDRIIIDCVALWSRDIMYLVSSIRPSVQPLTGCSEVKWSVRFPSTRVLGIPRKGNLNQVSTVKCQNGQEPF